MDCDTEACVQVRLIQKDIEGLSDRFDRHETVVKETLDDLKKTFKEDVKSIKESTANQWKNINALKLKQGEIEASQKATYKYAVLLGSFIGGSGLFFSYLQI